MARNSAGFTELRGIGRFIFRCLLFAADFSALMRFGLITAANNGNSMVPSYARTLGSWLWKIGDSSGFYFGRVVALEAMIFEVSSVRILKREAR